MLYTSHNSTLASRSSNDQKAFAIAENGINDALAILKNPTNNALSPGLLCAPGASVPCDSAHALETDNDGGFAKWYGVLNQITSTWSITSTGYTRNPTGASSLARTVRVSVHVTATLTQPLNNPAWNYVMALRTGNTCDMTIGNSVNITAPLYVFGNLCFTNTAWMSAGSLVVKGHLTLANPQNSIGVASTPISDAHIGNGCDYQSKKSQLPCTGGGSVNVFAKTVDQAVPTIVPPTVDWDTWYANASPGPRFPCVAAKSSAPSTWPSFDTGDGLRNNSVPTIWNLTPATAYDCWTDGGELKWDPAAKQLTVSGTIFIDGSATVNDGAVNTYVGQAALYLSGTFLVKNSSLCAVPSCTATGWDPNKALLVVVANGNGGQVPVGDSIQIVSGSFQGGLYGTNAVETDTTANVDGPILGATVILGQSVNSSFPFITIVPVATPGNPVVYAEPEAPTGFSG
jgi:phage baseplate assembly protein gpV